MTDMHLALPLAYLVVGLCIIGVGAGFLFAPIFVLLWS